METPPIIDTTNITNNSFQNKILTFFKNKQTVGIIFIIIAAVIFYLYKNNKLNFLKKNKDNKKNTVDEDTSVLNLDNEYYIYDNGNKVKLNLKELIDNYNTLLLQEQQQQEQQQQLQQQPLHQQQQLQQQQLQQQQLQQQQLQQQQLQQLQQQQLQQQQLQQQLHHQQFQPEIQQHQFEQQLQPKPQLKNYKKNKLPKIIHPTESIEEDSENISSTNDIEELKNQLVELEKHNKTILNNDE